MRILKRRPKDKESIKPGAAKVTDHRQFVQLIRELARAGGGKIDVFFRDSGNAPRGFLHEQPFDGVINVDNYLSALLENHGAGIYDHEVYNSKGMIAGSYQFTVGKVKPKKAKTSEEKAASRKTETNNDLVLKMMELNSQNAVSAKDMIEFMKANGNGKSTDLDNQIKIALVDKALDTSDDGTTLDVFLKAFEFARTMGVPKIEGQDTLTTIIQSLGPGLLQMLAAKSGIPQIQQGIMPVAGAPTSAVKPPQVAGLPQAAPDKDILPEGQLTADQEAFYKFVILPYRYAIEKEQDPEIIRNETTRLISTALDQAGDSPHPLVADLCAKWQAGDLVGLDSSIDVFFSLIPEISGNKSLQVAVKQSFVEFLTGPATFAEEVTAPEAERIYPENPDPVIITPDPEKSFAELKTGNVKSEPESQFESPKVDTLQSERETEVINEAIPVKN